MADTSELDTLVDDAIGEANAEPYDDGADADAGGDNETRQDAEGRDSDDGDDPADEGKSGESPEALQSKLAEAQKRYEELRSMNDRRFNEQREQMAKLTGQLETLTKVRGDEEAGMSQKQQEQFDAELTKAIEDGDAPKVLQMFRGMGREILEIARSEFSEKLSEVQGKVSSELLRQDAFVRRHKDEFDELVKGGMSKDSAITFMRKIHKDESVAQPTKRPAPGTAPAGAKRAASSNVSPGKIPETLLETCRYAGMSDKEANELWAEQVKEGRS